MSAQFFQPRTLEEAIGLLGQYAPEAHPLAGGTDLVVRRRKGGQPISGALVHLGHIPSLNMIAVDEAGILHIGALASHADVEKAQAIRHRWSALSDASAIVGSPATRYTGTVGGNLCNGSPAMESGGPLLAFNATVRLVGSQGERHVRLDEFFVAPGRTALRQDEVLAEILAPPLGERSGSAYVRLEFRRAMEIAIVGATAALELDAEGIVVDCRIALTSVAPVIIRVPQAEASLVGSRPTAEALDQAGKLAMETSAPITDVRAPATYRRDMVAVLTVRALRRALERAAR